MSCRVTFRVTARLIAVMTAALALMTGLVPAASAQQTGAHPLDTWRAPFPPPAPIPADARYVDTQSTTGPDQPGFWEPGPNVMLVVSRAPADSPTWCDGYWNLAGVRCWQVAPDGSVAELRRFSLLTDMWHGSSDPWAGAAYQAGYRVAYEMGWDYTSGGIVIPTGSGTAYSTMMPLGRQSPDADVWVAPGILPGS